MNDERENRCHRCRYQLPPNGTACRCVGNDRLAMDRLRIALDETERDLRRARALIHAPGRA